MANSHAVSSLSELFNSPTAYILDAMMREATREMTGQELAKKSALSRSSIHRYLLVLLGFDLICKTREAGQRSANYRLNMENGLVQSLFKLAGLIDDQDKSSRRGL